MVSSPGEPKTLFNVEIWKVQDRKEKKDLVEKEWIMRKQSKLYWFFVVSAFVVVTLAVWDLVHGDLYHGGFGVGVTIGCWIGRFWSMPQMMVQKNW
jgi:hypothetical protein